MGSINSISPSDTAPQEMDKHDFRTFGDSDQNHFYHLYWACIGGANGIDRWRKIKFHGKMKYCVLASPNDHRRWTNTVFHFSMPFYFAPSINSISPSDTSPIEVIKMILVTIAKCSQIVFVHLLWSFGDARTQYFIFPCHFILPHLPTPLAPPIQAQ